MFAKSYAYVGPEELNELVHESDDVRTVKCREDVQQWIKETGQAIGNDNEVIATFVVRKDKRLYISDRHAEHIVCAKGQPVLSAGEITFKVDKAIGVSAITNQSTGYCPEPQSWKYVAKALKKAKLEYGKGFTIEFIFRKCSKCDSINIVKDDWYVCAVCDEDLDKKWNFA